MVGPLFFKVWPTTNIYTLHILILLYYFENQPQTQLPKVKKWSLAYTRNQRNQQFLQNIVKDYLDPEFSTPESFFTVDTIFR